MVVLTVSNRLPIAILEGEKDRVHHFSALLGLTGIKCHGYLSGSVCQLCKSLTLYCHAGRLTGMATCQTVSASYRSSHPQQPFWSQATCAPSCYLLSKWGPKVMSSRLPEVPSQPCLALGSLL